MRLVGCWLCTGRCGGHRIVHQTLWSQHMILFQKRGMPTSLAETDSSCIAARSLCFQFENITPNHLTSCRKLVIDNQTSQDDTMWYHDTQPFFGTHQWPTRIISSIIGLGRGSSTRALSSCSTTGGLQRCCCCCCGMNHWTTGALCCFSLDKMGDWDDRPPDLRRIFLMKLHNSHYGQSKFEPIHG